MMVQHDGGGGGGRQGLAVPWKPKKYMECPDFPPMSPTHSWYEKMFWSDGMYSGFNRSTPAAEGGWIGGSVAVVGCTTGSTVSAPTVARLPTPTTEQTVSVAASRRHRPVVLNRQGGGGGAWDRCPNIGATPVSIIRNFGHAGRWTCPMGRRMGPGCHALWTHRVSAGSGSAPLESRARPP